MHETTRTIFVSSSSPKASIISDIDCATLSVYPSQHHETAYAHGLAVVEEVVSGVHARVVYQCNGIRHQSAHGSANVMIDFHNLDHTARERDTQKANLDGTINLLVNLFSTARTTPSFVFMPIAVEPSYRMK